MSIHIKNEIIRIIGTLDNGSHSSDQWHGIAETLTALFYAHLKELKSEIIKKSTFAGGVSSNGWYQIYKDDFDSIWWNHNVAMQI